MGARAGRRRVSAAWIAVAVLMALAGCGQSVPGSSRPPSAEGGASTAPHVAGITAIPAIQATPPPPGPKGPRPASAAVLVQRGPRGEGVLDVDNGMQEDAYVTLAIGPSLVLGVYVRGGSKAHTEGIADGTYNLYFATGDGWNSDLLAFTSKAAYAKFDDPFPYATTSDQSQSWSITLDPSPTGNASTSKVGAGDVPR